MKKKIENKNERCLRNENGFALISALLFGLLALGLISTAMLKVSASTQLGAATKRYAVELDSAKGAAGYVMAEIRHTNIRCTGSQTACTPNTATLPTCSAGAQIYMDGSICTALNKTDLDNGICDGLSACYLSETVYSPPFPSTAPDITFYSVRVTSANTIGETSEIDFVYKVE